MNCSFTLSCKCNLYNQLSFLSFWLPLVPVLLNQCHLSKYANEIFACDVSKCHSPVDASNEEDEVTVDFGAVDKLIDIAGVHCLSRLQAACPYTITH